MQSKNVQHGRKFDAVSRHSPNGDDAGTIPAPANSAPDFPAASRSGWSPPTRRYLAVTPTHNAAKQFAVERLQFAITWVAA